MGSRAGLGVLLVALATLAFASADVLTKHLTMRQPVAVIFAVRYLVNVALLAIFLGPALGRGLWRTERTSLVLVRGLCLALATLTAGLALRVMPVGETIAIIYIAPFVVMLLAAPLLDERVSLGGWIGAGAGFLGVLMIVRPGGGLDPWGVAFALSNAGLSAAYHLMTRALARTEQTIPMLFHAALVGSALFCVLALGALGGPAPGWTDFALMLALGALMTLGHFLFTAAYREAPASLLAPVGYLHLFWAGGLGWLVFGHVPHGWSLAGMTLVMGAGVLVALLIPRRRPPAPAPRQGG